MYRIKEIIVVEGRYDKNTLSQCVDARIIETNGFGIFGDGEKLGLLRRLARKDGLIILTDGDGAGFLIRNYLNGSMKSEGEIKHAYIPDIEGKERRKTAPSREGKIGVEGMSGEALIAALRRAGATFLDEPPADKPERTITKSDLYALGLSGGQGSAEKRAALLKRLDLPQRLTANALLDVLNALYGYDEFMELVV